jgi:hypothetical protein
MGEVKSRGWGRNTINKRLSGEVWIKSAKQYIANCGVADNRSMLKRSCLIGIATNNSKECVGGQSLSIQD